MKRNLFVGCGTALVTPFTNDKINFDELKKMLKFQIQNGADSIILCGTTGESSTLSLEEKKEIFRISVDFVNKRLPLIAGVGGNNTKEVIYLSKYAQSIGIDGLLIVTPYYNKTTQTGLITHYTQIAKNTNLPIILYNVPSRTGLNIEPNTCFELSKISNIVGIKEASGNISQITKIASICKENLPIYSGNDDQILSVLSIGGIGVISVVSNLLPKFIHNIVFDYLSGNFILAKDSQLKIIPLINSLFSEVNPIAIKYALNKFGFNVGTPRLPLVELSSLNSIILDKEMQKLKLIKNV